jgi:two-component system response regulator PilR (NtrC family)
MFGKEIRDISSYAMELLTNYAFPGNIRELENIIERSVAMESSNIILPESLTLHPEASSGVPKFDIEITDQGIDLNAELGKIEKIIIEKALQKTNRSKVKTAELLNVTFDSLRYRIEKLGIE